MSLAELKIKPIWKTTFLATIITGFLTHMYAMTNNLLTYDSMWNLYSDQDMITSGRQFLKYACHISSDYDLPWLNGVLAILWIALTAVITVEALNVKSCMLAGIIGALLVTFPSVTSTFAYSFTIDGYMLAVLLAVLAFFLTDRFKYGFIFGILCLGLSLGIYQAYITVTIVLCIFSLLLAIIEIDSVKEIFVKAAKYVIMGVGGYAFYIVTLKIMLAVKKVEISGYQGTDNLLRNPLANIWEGLKTAPKTFFDFALYGNVLTTSTAMKIAVVLTVLIGAVSFVYLFVKAGRHKSVLRYVLTAILVLCLPFGSTLICILSPNMYYHLLLRYAWAFMLAFMIVLADRCLPLHGRAVKISKPAFLAVILAGSLLSFEFAVYANVAYFGLSERYERTYSICQRITDRLYAEEGYTAGDPVAILGGILDASEFPSTDITAADMIGYVGVSGDYAVNSTHSLAAFASHYLGITITTIDVGREIELGAYPEFLEMPRFPEDGCIRKIDGVWVVKVNG